jgi:hypothetical protein
VVLRDQDTNRQAGQDVAKNKIDRLIERLFVAISVIDSYR